METALPLLMGKRREFNRNWEDILVVDTGGGRNSTVTKRVWHVFEKTNQEQLIKGYGSSNDGRICPIVNAATNATFPGRDEPVILILNPATLINDENESESLLVPFELMRHGIKVDLTSQNMGGVGAMYIEE
eukprot:14470779-Ditylum_brightwellii.AAC.1